MKDIIIPLVIASLAPAAAVFVALITAYKTKKLAYFQVYFERKFDAYSAFWSAASEYELFRTDEAKAATTSALHLIAMISTDEIQLMSLQLMNRFEESGFIDSGLLTDLNDAMRADLEACRQMNFPKA